MDKERPPCPIGYEWKEVTKECKYYDEGDFGSDLGAAFDLLLGGELVRVPPEGGVLVGQDRNLLIEVESGGRRYRVFKQTECKVEPVVLGSKVNYREEDGWTVVGIRERIGYKSLLLFDPNCSYGHSASGFPTQKEERNVLGGPVPGFPHAHRHAEVSEVTVIPQKEVDDE